MTDLTLEEYIALLQKLVQDIDKEDESLKNLIMNKIQHTHYLLSTYDEIINNFYNIIKSFDSKK